MSPFTVAMRVIGKSSHEEDENGEMKLHYNYYFPDGIFGSFNRRDQLVDTNPIPLNFVRAYINLNSDLQYYTCVINATEHIAFRTSTINNYIYIYIYIYIYYI